MSTDLNKLSKGLLRLGILVFLCIASPIILTMGFKALQKFTEAPKIYVAYALLFAASILIIFTVFFAFITFKTILNSFFNNEKTTEKQ